MAAMEGTASYWKPLYNILESSGLNAIVVNARHRKAVPGRKTDMKDAEWIAAFSSTDCPSQAIPRIRTSVNWGAGPLPQGPCRRAHPGSEPSSEDAGGANTKLSGTVSDSNGKSARNILECLPTGESTDSAKYGELYGQKAIAHNLKATKEQTIDGQNGVMAPLQRRMMKEPLAHLDGLGAHIRNLDDGVDRFMNPQEKQASNAIQDVAGIGGTSAQAIISVIGTGMGRFPSGRHISSWAGLCPGNKESAKKRKPGKTRKGNVLLRTTLATCAHAAVKNKKPYFYAQFMGASAHRGTKRA